MKEIKLFIEDDGAKKNYFDFLKNQVKVPVCKSCGKFFQLGFDNSEEGVCDYLICQENSLLCECECHQIIRNLVNQKEDGIVDITPYYDVIR